MHIIDNLFAYTHQTQLLVRFAHFFRFFDWATSAGCDKFLLGIKNSKVRGLGTEGPQWGPGAKPR